VLKASKKVLNFPQDLAGPLPNKCSRKQGWRSRPIVLQRRHLRVSSSALLNCKGRFCQEIFIFGLFQEILRVAILSNEILKDISWVGSFERRHVIKKHGCMYAMRSFYARLNCTVVSASRVSMLPRSTNRSYVRGNLFKYMV
jgi:hypothetical protein